MHEKKNFFIFWQQIGKIRQPAKQGDLENITGGFFIQNKTHKK
jgi:hypothetical protein